jgi:hypothetical protein
MDNDVVVMFRPFDYVSCFLFPVFCSEPEERIGRLDSIRLGFVKR